MDTRIQVAWETTEKILDRYFRGALSGLAIGAWLSYRETARATARRLEVAEGIINRMTDERTKLMAWIEQLEAQPKKYSMLEDEYRLYRETVERHATGILKAGKK